MDKINDLIERLRSMSRYEHDDLSIGDEAADVIEKLRYENKFMREKLQELNSYIRPIR